MNINCMIVLALVFVSHAGATTTTPSSGTTAAPCKCCDGNYCVVSVSVKDAKDFFQLSWTIKCVRVCVCVCVCVRVRVHAIFNVCVLCMTVLTGPTASASLCL